MAHVRDSDTALWLHNKLSSAEELWIPSSISGIIKNDTIDNIYRCFPVLSTTVKIKLLLGILHLPWRNLEEMKHMIEGIIEVGLEDSDIWVKLVANMVKNYPVTFNLNLDLRSSPIAQNVIQQLSGKVKDTDPFASLPLECQLVNKTSLQSLVGNLPPLNRHFALKRKPKSAALRAGLMQKSGDAVSQMKKGGIGSGTKTVPVKHRDMNRRASDVGNARRSSLKGQTKSDLNRSMSTSANTAQSQNRGLTRAGRQQAGGTKLLDISEQPIGGSGIGIRDIKRRKKQLQQQEAASQVQENDEEEDKTPDYAAGLISSNMTSQSVDETEQEIEVDEPQSFNQSQEESVDHDSSSTDEEVETESLQRSDQRHSSFLNSSKATSSESEMGSPQRNNSTLSSSSKEELKSPQYSTSKMPMYAAKQQTIQSAQHKFQQPNVSSPTKASLSTSNTQVPSNPMLSPIRMPMVQAYQPPSNMQAYQPPQISRQSTQPETSVPGSNIRMFSPPRPGYTLPQSSPQQQTNTARTNQPQLIQGQQSSQVRPQNFFQPGLPPTQQQVFMKQPQPQLNPPPPNRGLTLTREQMFEAQEMFRTANRLSRPEKATILGFMAGSRENPHPEQGDIVQIVLSETLQNIQNPSGGGILPVIVETLFEMNYRTGQSVKRQRFKAALAAANPQLMKT